MVLGDSFSRCALLTRPASTLGTTLGTSASKSREIPSRNRWLRRRLSCSSCSLGGPKCASRSSMRFSKLTASLIPCLEQYARDPHELLAGELRLQYIYEGLNLEEYPFLFLALYVRLQSGSALVQ